MRKRVLWVVLGMILVVANFSIAGKERVLREGQTVLLQLAPLDPRSLIQGDFMALRHQALGRQNLQVDERPVEEGPHAGRRHVRLRVSGIPADDRRRR